MPRLPDFGSFGALSMEIEDYVGEREFLQKKTLYSARLSLWSITIIGDFIVHTLFPSLMSNQACSCSDEGEGHVVMRGKAI